MKEVYAVADIAVEAKYGLDIPADICLFPLFLDHPNINDLVAELSKQNFDSIEELIDSIAQKVNSGIQYSKEGFQDRSSSIQQMESDLEQSTNYSEKVLRKGTGRCEDAGIVIRTILRHVLPEGVKIEQLSINSPAYENGAHDITLVYSPKGKVIVDSIRYNGHIGGVFSEDESPIELVKFSEVFQ